MSVTHNNSINLFVALFLLSIISTNLAKPLNSDERVAMKQKQNDLEARTRLSLVQNETTSDDPATKRFTKCSTDEPITIDPEYIPSSSDEDNRVIEDEPKVVDENERFVEEEKKEEEKKEVHRLNYLAPPKPKDLHNVYDDQ